MKSLRLFLFLLLFLAGSSARAQAPQRALTTAAAALTRAEKDQVLENLGDAPLYLATNHFTTFQRIAFSASDDGKHFRRLGKVNPFPSPAGSSLRDPAIIYYEPTGEFVVAYTPNAFGAGGEIGFCKTRDFRTVTDLGVVSMPGTGITPVTTWMGAWVVLNGEYYITFLPSAGTWDNPGVMWSKCNNPGTWTSWTNATAFIATNPGLITGTVQELNDVSIIKVGATYHLFCDGDAAGSGTHRLLHATSTSPWTGYGALTPMFVPAVEVEGCIPVLKTDGSWRFYYQPIVSNLYYIDANAALTSFGAETPVESDEVDPIGNGDVLLITDLALKQRILNALAAIPDVSTLSLKRHGPGVSQELFLRDQAGNYVGAYGIEGVTSNDSLFAASASMRFYAGSTIARGSIPTGEDMRLFPGGGLSLGNTTDPGAGALSMTGGDLTIHTAGKGLRVKEGSNARMGTSTLTSGTVTVSNTSVSASTRIFVSRKSKNASSAIGALEVGTVTASTSFVINAIKPADGTVETGDASTVDWLLVEPAP